MDNQCKCRIGLYTGLCMLLFDGTLHHVDAQGAAKTAAVSDSRLVTMTECEGVDNCTTWSFSGIQGTAKSKTGEVFASLLVEKTSGNMITIKRADTEGSKAGLTAIYTGTVKGNRLSGEYKASWPGQGCATLPTRAE